MPPTTRDEAQIIVEPQLTAKHSPLALISILTGSAAAFFAGLGGLGFLGPDEPRYAEVAREMFLSGDYISTRLCGCLWFEKPALLYWLSAGGYHLLGVNELAARVPSALAALFTVALVYFALRHIRLTGLGLMSSLVLATSGIFVAYARVATPDMILAATMAAALMAAFLATTASGAATTALWSLSFGFTGLSVLAKGLAGIVLVVVIVGAYLIITRQPRALRLRDCLIGLAIFLVIAGVWYVPVTVRHGWAFIDDFFIRHHFLRYTSNEFGHPQPFYFFPMVAIAGTAPWTFFLIPAVARLRSLKPRSSRRDALLTFAWIWVAAPVVFFSFSGSKLPGYILPIFPAMAVIIGSEVEQVWNGSRAAMVRAASWLTTLGLIGAGAGFVIYLRSESIEWSGYNVVLGALPLVIALVAAALAWRNARTFIAGAAGVVLSLVLCAVVLLFPRLRDEVSLKPLSLEVAAALRPGEKIAFYLKKEFAAVFYSEGRVLCEPKRGTTFFALHQDMLADALESEPSLIVITDAHWVEGLESDRRFTTEFIASQEAAGPPNRYPVALRVTRKRPPS